MPSLLAEHIKPVTAIENSAGNAFGTGDYISCKNAHKVLIVVKHSGANDTDLTISLMEATTVAGGSAQAVTATVPILVDVDAGTQSDTLVRQTDAANYAIDPATAGSCLLVMEWDPAKFSAGFDCIAVKGVGGHASNTVSAIYLVEQRYKGDQGPSVIID